MFIVGKSFFSKSWSKLNIKTGPTLCLIHIPLKMLAVWPLVLFQYLMVKFPQFFFVQSISFYFQVNLGGPGFVFIFVACNCREERVVIVLSFYSLIRLNFDPLLLIVRLGWRPSNGDALYHCGCFLPTLVMPSQYLIIQIMCSI